MRENHKIERREWIEEELDLQEDSIRVCSAKVQSKKSHAVELYQAISRFVSSDSWALKWLGIEYRMAGDGFTPNYILARLGDDMIVGSSIRPALSRALEAAA